MNNCTLTTGTIAKLCNVHVRTVIRWIDSGKINGYKLPGGDRRVFTSEFIKFLQQNNMPVPNELKINKPKVLIVDDNIEVTETIERILIRKGFKTCIAHDGFSAGSLLSSFQPDIITLDLTMPKLDGLSVIRHINSKELDFNLKILVISAKDISSLEEAVRLGAHDYIEKPFDSIEIVEKIVQLIDSMASNNTKVDS